VSNEKCHISMTMYDGRTGKPPEDQQ